MRLAELTAFYSVFSFHMPLKALKRAASIDAALAAGEKDFCLIQDMGHVFYGYDQLSFAMQGAIEACEVCGPEYLLARAVDDRETGVGFDQFLDDLARAVGTQVVDDDDCKFGIRLPHSLHEPLDVLALVVGGEDENARSHSRCSTHESMLGP